MVKMKIFTKFFLLCLIALIGVVYMQSYAEMAEKKDGMSWDKWVAESFCEFDLKPVA